MKIKTYNGYISGLITGSLSYYPIVYIFVSFLFFLFSLGFWWFLPRFSPPITLITILFSTYFLIVFLIGLFLEKFRKGNKESAEDLKKLPNNSSFLLDIFPIKNESIIITKCFELTFELMTLLMFSFVGLVFFKNDTNIVAIRGLVIILTVLSSTFITYINVDNFKIFNNYSTKTTTKTETNKGKESKSLITAHSLLLMLVMFMFINSIKFIYGKFENILDKFLDLILSSSILSFFGDFYVGLILLSLTSIVIIYFNYFYLVKKKLKELTTVSNWREL